MRLVAGGVVAAVLALATGVAHAQSSMRHDVEGPYAAMPVEPAVPRFGPRLLPPTEVYTVVRDNGFSPLGIPRQRGLVYTISVIDHGGDDGRLVIDARSGRIIRFILARRMGDHLNDHLIDTYGPVGALPPMPSPAQVRAIARPPKPIPRVASRTVPLPKPHPLSSKPAPTPAQQSAEVQPQPAEAQAILQTEPSTVGQAKAAPILQPTQEMPAAQGLE